MRLKLLSLSLLSLLVWCGACTSHYELAGIDRTRVLIDNRFDARPDAQAAAFIMPYQAKVDSMIKPVVGRVGSYLFADRPESPLSNLLTDIMFAAAEKYNEHPDFAVYNIGGMRAALAEGEVTVGDVTEVAPFENKICFLTLTGEKVKELFQQIAIQGGEGVSRGVKLVITKDGKLVSGTLNGKEIDPNASYRIATLDYLAQGNDRMVAFKAKTDVNQPEAEENNIRFIIMDYLREQMAKGVTVDAKVEGRITIVQ